MSCCDENDSASPNIVRHLMARGWFGGDLRREALYPEMGGRGRRTMMLGALAALGGCGFRPLYGGGSNTGAGRLFESVRVEREPGEAGFRLHESLVERLRPVAGTAPMVLVTKTRLIRDQLAIEEDDQVTRFNLRVITSYTLRRAGAGPSDTPLTTGEVRSIAAYNATASQYATLVSERQSVRRASEEIADKIVKRLALAYDPAWEA